MQRTEQIVYGSDRKQVAAPPTETATTPESDFPRCSVEYHAIEPKNGGNSYHAATIETGFFAPETWNFFADDSSSKSLEAQLAHIMQTQAEVADQLRQRFHQLGFNHVDISFVRANESKNGAPVTTFRAYVFARITT